MNTKQKGIASTAIVALIAIVLIVPMAFAVLIMVGTTAVAGFAIVLTADSKDAVTGTPLADRAQAMTESDRAAVTAAIDRQTAKNRAARLHPTQDAHDPVVAGADRTAKKV